MDSVEVMEAYPVHYFRTVQNFMRRFMRQGNITEDKSEPTAIG